MAVSDDFLFKLIYNRLHDRPIEAVIAEYGKAKSAMMQMEDSLRAGAEAAGLADGEPPAPLTDEAFSAVAEGVADAAPPAAAPEEACADSSYTAADLERNPQNAIGDNYIICCLCGEQMKSLSRHLRSRHRISPEKYREICGYGKDVVLMSRNAAKAAADRLTQARGSRGGQRHPVGGDEGSSAE